MKKTAPKKKAQSRLTLGPLFFHWSPEKRRDFYYRIADEAAVDCVYLGEVVCSKREPFFDPFVADVLERLTRSGKEVVRSTLALVTSPREKASIEEMAKSQQLVEANDVACIQILAHKSHVIGPFINVFNEGTRDYLVRNGAVRIVLPVEAPAKAIEVIANRNNSIETEIQVFGKQPLSVAMRCYHARSRGLNKDSCQFVCGEDADGLRADTVDNQALLTVNGTQTLSLGYVMLLDELAHLQNIGVTHFRLSPQDVDMVRVAEIYRTVLDKKCSSAEGKCKLKKATHDAPSINGFYYGQEGMAWVDPSNTNSSII